MPRVDFEKLICDGINALPANIRAAMENLEFVLEDNARPGRDNEIKIEKGKVLLGLYKGIPKTMRGRGYYGVLPDKITLFQEPIERIAAMRKQPYADLIREVVWHEVGHHLGLSDEEIYAIEAKRRARQKPYKSP